MSVREEVLIIAHRGASADRPENTRDAFLEAARQGADWVELDVRAAADGGLIVHHDAWYHDQRTVWSTPTDARPRGVLVLDEALDACREVRPMGVNVEIKNLPGDLGDAGAAHTVVVADAVVDLLARRAAAGIDEEVLVTSFDPATIDRVRDLGGPPTGQLVVDVRALPGAVASTARRGHRALNPGDAGVDAELVAAAHGAGLAVHVWTVDDPARAAALAAMGVDGIITNVPGALRRALPGFVTGG